MLGRMQEKLIQVLKNSIWTRLKKSHEKINYFNTTIPWSRFDHNKTALLSDTCEKPCNTPYGVAPSVHDSSTCSSKHQPAARVVISIKDCVSNTIIHFIFCCIKFFASF